GATSATTPAIIATPSKVAFNWYGRSPSLQNRIASNPDPVRISTSRATDSTIARGPPISSYKGVPGIGGRCAIATTGFSTPKSSRSVGGTPTTLQDGADGPAGHASSSRRNPRERRASTAITASVSTAAATPAASYPIPTPRPD